MINRSVPLTVALVLAGGIGVTSALGSLGGDPVGPTTTVATVAATTQDVSALVSGSIATTRESGTTDVTTTEPGTTNPAVPGIVAAGMPSAPPAVSIARGDDDDDDDDDDDHYDDDDEDHDDDDDHDEEDDD